MTLEIGSVAKGLGAYVALEWLLTSMYSFVSLEVSAAAEAFVAKLALVRLLAGVDTVVLAEVGAVLERLVALLASVLFGRRGSAAARWLGQDSPVKIRTSARCSLGTHDHQRFLLGTQAHATVRRWRGLEVTRADTESAGGRRLLELMLRRVERSVGEQWGTRRGLAARAVVKRVRGCKWQRLSHHHVGRGWLRAVFEQCVHGWGRRHSQSIGSIDVQGVKST